MIPESTQQPSGQVQIQWEIRNPNVAVQQFATFKSVRWPTNQNNVEHPSGGGWLARRNSLFKTLLCNVTVSVHNMCFCCLISRFEEWVWYAKNNILKITFKFTVFDKDREINMEYGDKYFYFLVGIKLKKKRKVRRSLLWAN